MTDEPKALVVLPMPEVWSPLKTTCYDDRKKWIDYARQLAEIAQAQAQRADELQATLINRGSVYVTDGHGALWGTAESITWVTDELDRLEAGWDFYKSLYEKACEGNLMQTQANTIKNLRATLAQRDREVLGLRAALERVVSRFAPVKHEFIFSQRNALEKAESALTSTADAADKAAILGAESGEAQP